MKKFRVLLAVAGAALCAFAFSACLGNFDYDSDDSILKTRSFSSTMSVVNNNGASYKFSAQSCKGVSSVKKGIAVPENPVFDLTLKLDAGRFKVVLISGDTVYKICEGTAGEVVDEPVATAFAAGTYDLLIAADGAEVEFTFNFNDYQ